jgi:hypothetical protein
MIWPSSVVGNVQTETPLALGNPQTSPLTGATQGGGSSVILWQLDVSFPVQVNMVNIQAIRAILARHKQETVVFRVRQPALNVGTTGTVTVGAGHVAGTKSLPVVGVNSTLAMKAGQFLSISTGGRWYLYTLSADSNAGTTSRTLQLTSTTRAAHASGDVVEIAEPWIEGWIQGDPSVSVDVNQHYTFGVSVREAR